MASVVATRAAGPAASARALGLVGAGGMLANVVGVPLGAFAGQLAGWRGPFWARSRSSHWRPWRSSPATSRTTALTVKAVSLRSELAALRSGRL